MHAKYRKFVKANSPNTIISPSYCSGLHTILTNFGLCPIIHAKYDGNEIFKRASIEFKMGALKDDR